MCKGVIYVWSVILPSLYILMKNPLHGFLCRFLDQGVGSQEEQLALRRIAAPQHTTSFKVHYPLLTTWGIILAISIRD